MTPAPGRRGARGDWNSRLYKGRKAELEERGREKPGGRGPTDAEEIKRVKLEASENIERERCGNLGR